MPKPKMSVMISERYSETFGNSSITGCPSTCCVNPIENWINSGIATKYTTDAPSRKKHGVAMR